MLNSLGFGRRVTAAVAVAVVAVLAGSWENIANADDEFRARVTVTNRTGEDLHFDPEQSEAVSPMAWWGTETAAFDHDYIQRTIRPGDSRTSSSFGTGS